MQILFPQFANRGELTKYGFVRGVNWEMVSHDFNALCDHLSYELNINSHNFSSWPHTAHLPLEVMAEAKSIIFSFSLR